MMFMFGLKMPVSSTNYITMRTRHLWEHWPSIKLFVFLLEVFQLFHPFDFLLSEGIYTLPGAVDVGPAFPLDEELSFPFIFLRVKVCSRVPIFLNSIESCGSSSSCKQGGEKLRALMNKSNSWCVSQNITYKKKNFIKSSLPPFLPILVSRTFSMVSLSSSCCSSAPSAISIRSSESVSKSFWSSL